MDDLLKPYDGKGLTLVEGAISVKLSEHGKIHAWKERAFVNYDNSSPAILEEGKLRVCFNPGGVEVISCFQSDQSAAVIRMSS